MNNPYGYKLLRKKEGEKYKLAHYCPTYDFAEKIIDMFKKRKIIVLGEPKSAIKKSKWKIVPITKYEAAQAEKDVPFWRYLTQLGFFTLYQKL